MDREKSIEAMKERRKLISNFGSVFRFQISRCFLLGMALEDFREAGRLFAIHWHSPALAKEVIPHVTGSKEIGANLEEAQC